MKNKTNMGKQVKDLGVLIIIVGIVMAGILIMGIGSDADTPLYYLVDHGFVVLLLGSLLCLLFGTIIRSIGRSKEMKYMQNNPQMYGQPGYMPQQPYMPQQYPSDRQYYRPQQPNDQNYPNDR